MGRKHGERKSKTKIITIIIVIVIIAASMVVTSLLYKDKLNGSWITEGGTIYRFDGKGKGSIITSLSRNEFTYKVKKDNIFIDFASDKVKDSNYIFSIDEEKLYLKGINETAGSYTLTKQ